MPCHNVISEMFMLLWITVSELKTILNEKYLASCPSWILPYEIFSMTVLNLGSHFPGEEKSKWEKEELICPWKFSLYKEFWMYRSTFSLYSMMQGNRKCNVWFLCCSCLHAVQSVYILTLTFLLLVHAFLHRNSVKLLSAITMHTLWVVKLHLSQTPTVHGYDLTFGCFLFFTFSSKLSHLANSLFWK